MSADAKPRSTDADHLDHDTLADLLSGEIEDDDLHGRVLPHLLAQCPACQRRVDGLRKLQRRFDHWNESIVLREGREAPRLLSSLLEIPPEERPARLAADESFHTWGLVQLLLRRSREAARTDGAEASELAELALALVDHLPPEPYHPDWLADLRARTWAVVGNARRVNDELLSAEAAFRRAVTTIELAGTGRPEVRADVLEQLAALKISQRRFQQAHRLLREVEDTLRLTTAEGTESPEALIRVLLHRARAHEEAGETDQALAILEDLPALLKDAGEPRLLLCARHNLLSSLVAAGRFEDAREELPRVQALQRHGSEADRWRLRWVEGRIAQGLGDVERAESLLRKVRERFLDREQGYDAALVSLDLALLYAGAGRRRELEDLAAEILPLFHSLGVEREAFASLLLFQRAVEQRTVGLELLRELRSFVERWKRPGPGG